MLRFIELAKSSSDYELSIQNEKSSTKSNLTHTVLSIKRRKLKEESNEFYRLLLFKSNIN